jgi:hypothetical protein
VSKFQVYIFIEIARFKIAEWKSSHFKKEQFFSAKLEKCEQLEKKLQQISPDSNTVYCDSGNYLIVD